MGAAACDHSLDIYECIWTATFFQDLQSVLNQISDVFLVPLMIIDAVTRVQIVVLEHIKDGEELPVVWHQCLANVVC